MMSRKCGRLLVFPFFRYTRGVVDLRRCRVRGWCADAVDPSRADIVDEAIDLFRANSLFRNFEIKGGADRVRAAV